MLDIFDILGPVMIGPSSSHTAGAARIGAMARTLLGKPPVKAAIHLYGSFAETGAGHGTDRALVGGLLGFLVYNHYPAKVFMGDTGSLFLGGAVAALAFAYDMPLILLLVGFVYLCETLSDIIQVGYFKLTHGKRIFKMAPLHHHFELCGWSEVKLVTIFTLVSAVFCMLALWGVIGRYHF